MIARLVCRIIGHRWSVPGGLYCTRCNRIVRFGVRIAIDDGARS